MIVENAYVAPFAKAMKSVVSKPVFVAGRLVGFCCNRAHQADIGGGAAGMEVAPPDPPAMDFFISPHP